MGNKKIGKNTQPLLLFNPQIGDFELIKIPMSDEESEAACLELYEGIKEGCKEFNRLLEERKNA